MAWQTPKTNWQAGDIPGAGDFNRIEGNTQYLKEQTDGLSAQLMGKKIVLIASGAATIADSDRTIILNNARDGDFLIASTRFDWEIHYGRPTMIPPLPQPVYYLRLRLPSGFSQMTTSYQVIALRDV
jgi:hypothetical protein